MPFTDRFFVFFSRLLFLFHFPNDVLAVDKRLKTTDYRNEKKRNN